MNRRNVAGFTLIELLVVIAIIAILAAILFPVYSRAKEQGRIAGCQSNMKQLVTALHMYVDDSGGRLPKPQYFGKLWYRLQVSNSPSMFNKGPYIQDLLMPYMKNANTWLCPSLRPNIKFSRNPDASGNYDFSKYTPADNNGTTTQGILAASNYMWIHWRYAPRGDGDVDASHTWVSGVPTSKMKQASKVIIFLEFPYWEPSPHTVYDQKGFHVGDHVAYYDGHVKLTRFPNHAWPESYRGW